MAFLMLSFEACISNCFEIYNPDFLTPFTVIRRLSTPPPSPTRRSLSICYLCGRLVVWPVSVYPKPLDFLPFFSYESLSQSFPPFPLLRIHAV